MKQFRGRILSAFLMVVLFATFTAYKSSAHIETQKPLKAGAEHQLLQVEAEPVPVEGNTHQYVDLSSDPSIGVATGFEDNQTTSTVEGFESGTKGSYATGTVTLGTGSWTMTDALIGNLANDRKTGAQSARIQNTGKLTMNFNVASAGTVTIQHAVYGADAGSTWDLYYSTTNGTSWSKIGSTVSTSSTSLQTASFTVNVSSSVRFEVRKTGGGTNRLNIDNITISGATAPPPPTCTATAITLPATVNGSLANTDCSVSGTGKFADKYSFTGASGQQVTITLNSTAFDCFLYLDGPSGFTQLTDDDSNGGTNSKLVVNLTLAGTYTVSASSYGNGEVGSYTLSVTANTTTPPPTSSSVHMAMGNPSAATTDVSVMTNYLMEKPQYALSYNNTRRCANWVSWHLDSTDIGSTPRQDDFRPDSTLPAGYYQVPGTAFGTGYDRGHMCPSADRTSSVANNSATFLMTNMIAQASDNNQGPWAAMENDIRALLNGSANEAYIISGGSGSKGTISVNGMTIPTRTWKIVVILPAGTNDVSRITTATRVIAVNMPNDAGIRSVSWKTYRVSVDSIETLTGYDFLSNVPASVQSVIEARVDNL
ncbi:MAG: DNA/RNA non-specific endonuclease [Blastocatellia bacterium]|nr:DNA/RNA non-specific endonuclease [Blastocatellia bacterium]